MPELLTAPPAPQPAVPEITQEIQALVAKAGLVAERLRAEPTTVDTKAIDMELATIKSQLEPLVVEQERQTKDATIKSLQADVEYLMSHASQPRKHEFDVAGQVNGAIAPGRGIEKWAGKSFAAVLAAGTRRGANPEAAALLWEWHLKNAADWDAHYGTKALAEGATTSGGFLVPAQYIQELVMLRRATAPMLQYVRSLPVHSNQVLIPTQTTASTVGWTAENAVKPSTDEVFGQITVNVFTLAGIAKISNQLLEDSTPAVDAVVREDLLRGLNIEMDRTILNGSGTGQSTGILNTAGITVTASAADTTHPQTLFDDILAAIGRLQAAYFGPPDAIVMAPRTWSKIQGAKDSTGRFLGLGTLVGSQTYNAPQVPNPTGASMDNNSLTGGMTFTIFGYPVIVDANMPINQTGGAQSSIIVAALRESWALMRDEIRMDTSNEAGTSFESNQTWFRGEMRMGFTAARLPSAIQIVNAVVA
jgi:HK97 family phage major capsid protein